MSSLKYIDSKSYDFMFRAKFNCNGNQNNNKHAKIAI